MAFKLRDAVHETTTTTGTGTYDLQGAIDNRLAFSEEYASGDTCFYTVTDGTDVESGIGTYTAATPDTLSRDTILYSTQSNSAVNWPAGTKDVVVGLPGTVVTDLLNTATTGLIARTGNQSWAGRSIAAGGGVTVTNADGSGGNPTVNTGTAAAENTGTSGSNVPKLDGANDWSARQRETGSPSPGWEVQDTGQSLPAGLFRHRANGDQLRFERNTDVSGDFSGVTEILRMYGTGGVQVGSPTGGDPGAGKLNAEDLEVGGNPVLESGTHAGAKAWVSVDGSDGSNQDSFGVSNTQRNGQGDYTITWSTAFSSTNYVVQAMAVFSSVVTVRVSSRTTTTCRLIVEDAGDTTTTPEVDPTALMVTAYGNQ